MAALKTREDQDEERLARIEHMLEELRVQTSEFIRLAKEAREDARATREQIQNERAARRRPNGSHASPSDGQPHRRKLR